MIRSSQSHIFKVINAKRVKVRNTVEERPRQQGERTATAIIKKKKKYLKIYVQQLRNTRGSLELDSLKGKTTTVGKRENPPLDSTRYFNLQYRPFSTLYSDGCCLRLSCRDNKERAF